MSASFIVYQASAGSGKTYTIVKEYLRLLFEASYSQPFLEQRLRSLLAVTFTNKAAAEMKERILYALQGLTRGDTSLYPELHALYPDLSKRAKFVLQYLLHHYSFFSITTIDSFLSRLVQSIAFELKIPFQCEILLEKKALFKEILSDILENFQVDVSLTKLFEDMILYSIEKNTSSIEKVLLQEADTIYKEAYYIYLYPVLNSSAFCHEGEMYNCIKENYFRLKARRKEIAQRVISEMKKRNIVREMLPYRGSGNLSFFENILKDNNDNLNYESSRLEQWTREDTSGTVLEEWVTEVVFPALDELRWQKGKENTEFFFRIYDALIFHLFFLALMTTFQKHLEHIIKVQQRIPIEEFGRKLHEALSGESVPYLYMRLGEQYRYFFIDEFQDTSRLQWKNLSPLIAEALADGGEVYLVGDPKQAIYRWRNGDVRIMLQEIENQFSFPPERKNLSTNYRSSRVIVQFVNTFFNELKNYFCSPEDSFPLFRKSYTDMEQKASREEEGVVHFDFKILANETSQEEISDEEDREDTTTALVEWCIQKIQEAKSYGYTYRDVAILVRKNKTAISLAPKLLEKGIPVVTGDALFVASSEAVRLLIEGLRLLVRPSDLNALLAFLELSACIFSSPFSSDVLYAFFNTIQNFGDIRAKVEEYKTYHESFGLVYTLLNRRLDLFTLALPDAVEEMIREFGLHEKKETHAFLAKFLDAVREFFFKTSGSISDFLTVWDEEISSTLVIDPDESADAVRIMSIHKAKGLEFSVVLFPLLSEKTRSDKHILAPFPEMILQLHQISEKYFWLYRMKKTLQYFPVVDRAYQDEKDLSLLDEINLLYVVFTRARDALCVYVPLEEIRCFSDFSFDNWQEELEKLVSDRKDMEQTKLGLLVLWILSHQDGVKTFAPTMFSFMRGTWLKKVSNTSFLAHKSLSSFSSSPWQKKMRVHAHEAEIHLLFHEKQRESREKGIILHELLASVWKESDIEKVVKTYTTSLPGVLSEEDQNEITGLLQEIWQSFVRNGWIEHFSVHNEETLLTPLGLIRPDKVFLARDMSRAIVVDYKSGFQGYEQDEKVIVARYSPQLRAYCEAIKKMGYTEVEGYVLFITTKQLHKVV